MINAQTSYRIPNLPVNVTPLRSMPAEQFGRPVDKIVSQPAGGGGIQFPFQLQKKTIGGSPYVNVRYGTMQDIEPTDTATDIALTSDGTWNVYIHVVIDGPGAVVSATLVVTLSAMPANGNYDGYILLGQVIVASGAITTVNQAATHSLRTAMCGRVWDSGTSTLTTPGTWEFWGF
jgi:hypothetical protein